MKIKILLISCAMLSLSQASHALELNTQEQKFSYTLGIQIGQMLQAQDVNEVEIDAFAAAVSDYLAKKKPLMSQADMQESLKLHYQQLQLARDKAAKENISKGTQFREENAKNKGVTVLENGLQYEELRPGSGTSPTEEDKVEVHYKGTLIDGTEFDSSYKRGKPAQFTLKGVVPGFKEAIVRMKPGAKWRVVMPPEMAYGEKGAGKDIGPNETLIFEIEYLGLAAKPQAK